MGTEIERKYLVKHRPDSLGSDSGTPIRQGYLIATGDGVELRLRQKADRFFQTIKMGQGLSRTEIEITLSREQFDALWPYTVGRRVSKIRYHVSLGEHVAELDRFEDDLAGLEMVEVEFSSVPASQRFDPPAWFGREVTTDERYKNKWLAENGIPKD